MTTSRTYFRVQTADRDVTGLLDPEQQTSESWQGGAAQVGVSVCESREALAMYLAGNGAGIPIGAGEWVLVALAGELLGHGADDGELLVRPTQIVSVAPLDEDFYELIGAAYDAADAA
jgi:hypothetical protein